MNHHHARHLCGVLLGTLVAVSCVAVAKAEDRSTWFHGLLQPGTGVACCDVSDCRKAEADWHSGQWWATVDGQWTPIPPNTELSKRSIDGDAYVCAGANRYVYCFVNPDLSM